MHLPSFVYSYFGKANALLLCATPPLSHLENPLLKNSLIGSLKNTLP